MSTVKFDRPFGISQVISTGNHFDGTEPAGTPTFANRVATFAAEAAGGLINLASSKYDFINQSKCYDLIGIDLDLGGQNVWTLSRIDAAGNTVVFANGTTEASYFAGKLTDSIVLFPGDKIKIVTSAGTPTGLVITVKLEPHVLNRRL